MAIIAVFFCWGLVYSVVVPIGEALDEVWHFAVVHHIKTERALPIQPADPAESGLWRQQGSQPPLYYLLGSLLIAPIETRDFPSLVRYNPHASGGHPETPGNKNILLHNPQVERFPYRGTALAFHVLRLYSLALGALTIYGVYRIALHLWPGRHGLACLAASFVAFNPQFIFVHAGVINDTLAITLSTWVLERLVWLVGAADPLSLRSWRSWALVGAGSGLALLSKLSAGLLLPLAGLTLIWLAWRRRAWPRAALFLLLIGVIALALSGWWLVRNWRLYGDPTGLNRFIPVAGARPTNFGLRDFWGELEGLELSYWAVFGWFSILVGRPFYIWVQTLDRLAVIGLGAWLWRWAKRRLHIPAATAARLGLLAAWFLLLLVALYRWTAVVMGTQGRLLFPGAASVAIGWLVGLSAWPPRRWRLQVLGLVAGLLALSALVIPFLYLLPAYRLPRAIADETAISEKVHLRYGDWGELVGYDLPQAIIEPGGELPLTLYWRGIQRVAEPYDLYIHLRDADGSLLGQLDTWPGWGMYPTLLWEPDQIVADPYRIRLVAKPDQPLVGRIEVGFCCAEGGSPFAAYDPAGRRVTPVIGRFKVRGTAPPVPVPASGPTFEEQIMLAAWRVKGESGEKVKMAAGDNLSLTLEWAPLRRPDDDYTVFVHLVGDEPQPLAQDDGEPQGGRYPTSFWERGERIQETRQIALSDSLPCGEYHLLVGLYRRREGTRLRVNEPPGDAYRLPTTVEIYCPSSMPRRAGYLGNAPN